MKLSRLPLFVASSIMGWLFTLPSPAWGQGTIGFAGSPVVPVLHGDTGLPAGPEVSVGLYYSDDLDARPEHLVLGGTTQVIVSGIFNNGGVPLTLPLPPGTQVLVEIRAWTGGYGSYEQALQQGGQHGHVSGVSGLLNPMGLGGPGTSAPNIFIQGGYSGITLHPIPIIEPPTNNLPKIEVANPSFEQAVVQDGTFLLDSIPGWTGEGTILLYNPSDTHFTGTTEGSPEPNPIDGVNAVALLESARLSQDLPATLQTDMEYTLTALIGHRRSVPLGDPTVRLLAGDVVLTEAHPRPADDQFEKMTLTYRSPSASSLKGQSLRVEIQGAGSNAQVWVDDICLVLDSVAVVHFDLAGDFSIASNPNGVWSYGWKSTVEGPLTLVQSPSSMNNGGVVIEDWTLGPGEIPQFQHNTSLTTVWTFPGGTLEPGWVNLLAGNDDTPHHFAVARFTAPRAGTYRFESAVQNRLSGAASRDAEYRVAVNDVEVFSDFLNPNTSIGYTNQWVLQSGETVDILSGRGADGLIEGSGNKTRASFKSEVPCTPDTATAVARVVNGFVVGAIITDTGCGYTNTPSIHFEGGEGVGAMAEAIVQDGRVVAIEILNAGTGYTAPTLIAIDEPTFAPTLTISVESVKVSMSVRTGETYVLESTTNFVDWTPTGPAFLATSDTVEKVFQVESPKRFFRVRLVP